MGHGSAASESYQSGVDFPCGRPLPRLSFGLRGMGALAARPRASGGDFRELQASRRFGDNRTGCDGIGVNVLKHLVGRPRPSQIEPGVRMVTMGSVPIHFPKVAGVLSSPVVSYPHGQELPEVPGMLTAERPATGRSFPSGHAANNMAVATVLILFYPRRGWLYLPVALLIAYARIYTGSHWPLDVIAGIILGIGGGWLAVKIIRFLWCRFSAKIMPVLADSHPDLIA